MFERYYVRWQRRYPDQSHLLESLLVYISYWKPLAAKSHMQYAPAWHNDSAHEVLTALCRCIQAGYIHSDPQNGLQAAVRSPDQVLMISEDSRSRPSATVRHRAHSVSEVCEKAYSSTLTRQSCSRSCWGAPKSAISRLMHPRRVAQQ